MSPQGRAGALSLLLIAALAAGAALLVSRDAAQDSRLVVPAMESQQAAELAAQGGVALPDFWARAKAMGLVAAIVRPQSLDDAIRTGEILRFDRGEVQRWKAAGLLSPNTTLKPDTFWTKDERLYEQLLQAVARQGITPTTSTLAGYRVVQVPEGSAALALQGYDPDRLSALDGLTPIYAPSSGLPAVVGLRWQGAAVAGDADPAAARAAQVSLEPVYWDVGDSISRLLRASLGKPRRLLVITLDPSLGLEGNFTRAREALRALEAEGTRMSIPSAPPQAPSGGALSAAALVAAWLIGVLGPLFSARGGLLVLRRARGAAQKHLPAASPLAQLAAGLLSTAAFAAAAGVVIHALGARWGLPLGGAWARTTLVGPLVIAVLTLYTIDVDAWGKALARPVTYRGLLGLAALAAGAAVLLAPRWLLHRLGAWEAVRAASALAPAAWWWLWRWREMLVGVPALVQALFLINWRLECPDCSSLPAKPANDPRHWFLLGLLLPVGIVTAVGQGAAPETLALLHTGWTLLVGAFLGGLLIVARLRAARHAHGQPDASHPKGPAAA